MCLSQPLPCPWFSWRAVAEGIPPPAEIPAHSTASAGTATKDSAILATSGEPTRFFPCGADGSNGNDYLVLNNIYDTLVFLDADGTIQPCLAKDWTISEDGLCYTFHLQEGVTFHDEHADDRRGCGFTHDLSVQNSTGKALIINYDHAEAVDDNTVKIYLTAPYAAFLNGVRLPPQAASCSKAYYEEVGEEGYQAAPVGTGPYKFVSAVSGDTITLEANENYWREPAAIRTI